jgi:hypothetical protein
MQWKASGLTAVEFGARRGISKQQLHNWASRLGLTRKNAGIAKDRPAAVRLVPIVRHAAQEMAGRTRAHGTGIRLSFAGATMDVEAGFDPATLRKILQVARSIHEGERS